MVLKGKIYGRTGLWTLPITPRDNHETRHKRHTTYTSEEIQHSAAASVYTLPYKQQRMEYMHQSFVSLPAPTLIKAIDNKQLITSRV